MAKGLTGDTPALVAASASAGKPGRRRLVKPTATVAVTDGGQIQPRLVAMSTMANQALDGIATLARYAGEQARLAASTAGGAAQGLARRAQQQAETASDTLYRRGALAGDSLTWNVGRHPLSALLMAGAIGWGLGYLIRVYRARDRAAGAAGDH